MHGLAWFLDYMCVWAHVLVTSRLEGHGGCLLHSTEDGNTHGLSLVPTGADLLA